MISNRANNSSKRAGSMGLALLFLAIAILGIAMTTHRSSQRPSLAAPDSSFVLQNNTESPKSFSSLVVRTVVVTGVLIVIFLMAIKYYKKRITPDSSGRFHFEVLGKRYLSPKQYLVMVRVDESRLLLGVTDHSINLLKEYIETEEDETFESSTPMSATQSFIKMWKRENEDDSSQEKARP